MAYYVFCDDDCKYEGMTKAEILEAIEAALEKGYVSDPTGAVFSRIKELNANGTLQFWKGTEAQFNALNVAVTRSVIRIGADGTLYLCTDDTSLNSYVPTSRKVNGHSLKDDFNITETDIFGEEKIQRAITFGTAEPTGGKHGDIYIMYEE